MKAVVQLQHGSYYAMEVDRAQALQSIISSIVQVDKREAREYTFAGFPSFEVEVVAEDCIDGLPALDPPSPRRRCFPPVWMMALFGGIAAPYLVALAGLKVSAVEVDMFVSVSAAAAHLLRLKFAPIM